METKKAYLAIHTYEEDKNPIYVFDNEAEVIDFTTNINTAYWWIEVEKVINIDLMNIDQNDKEMLIKALYDRGFYIPYDVFNHPPDIFNSQDNKYDYRVEIMKWNTRSSKLVILGARWDNKKGRFIISTYKQGSTKMQSHNEKMR